MCTSAGSFCLEEPVRRGRDCSLAVCTQLPSFLFPLNWCSYNDVEDEHRATNIVITADEDFKDLKVSHMGVSSEPCNHLLALVVVGWLP